MKTFRVEGKHKMNGTAVYIESGKIWHENIVEDCFLWLKAPSLGAARRRIQQHIAEKNVDVEILSIVRVPPQLWMREDVVYATRHETWPPELG